MNGCHGSVYKKNEPMPILQACFSSDTIPIFLLLFYFICLFFIFNFNFYLFLFHFYISYLILFYFILILFNFILLFILFYIYFILFYFTLLLFKSYGSRLASGRSWVLTPCRSRKFSDHSTPSPYSKCPGLSIKWIGGEGGGAW